MTQENKQLLLIDFCARSPYKPKALVNGHLATILGIDENVVIVCIDGNDYKDEAVISADDNSDDITLYLRPMSSMTEEERDEYHSMQSDIWKPCGTQYYDNWHSIDWLNAHHFDYRGLIEKRLAISTEEYNPY